MKYSIVGLGKLGASMAAAIASRGYEVVGVDVEPRVVEAVNRGHAPVQETGLEELIQRNRERIRATESASDAISQTEVTFVIVPTPSDERGAFSLAMVSAAFREMGKSLKEKKAYHLFVLTSTVLPGASRYGIIPILESESGMVCGEQFGFCYSPEFIALGTVIRDFLHPDFTLVGEFDRRSGELLEKAYSEIMPEKPPCHRMSIENAELAKISVNSYVTAKISFANMLADICEQIPGGNVDDVTRALGADKRIGEKYLKGALGFGGPCFPRDNGALRFLCESLGVQAAIPEATNRANDFIPKRIVEKLLPFARAGKTVAILGLAYKPDSHVLEESQALTIAELTSGAGARVVAFDPLVTESSAQRLFPKIELVGSAKEAIECADVVLIATPDMAFARLGVEDFIRAREITVIDCWRLLEGKLKNVCGVNYIAIGESQEDEANAVRLSALWAS